MVIRAGIVGFSDGNGHPISFSAILNGYEDEKLKGLGWDVIHQYLRRRDAADFGVPGLSISHIWTHDAALTDAIGAACRIPCPVESLDDMLGQVDAVIIARDDADSHWPLAQPFLEAGLPVFIDKPLTTDLEELGRFEKFLRKGQLMSCAGMKYAKELDWLRANVSQLGQLLTVRGAIVKDWTRYGIHLLDACLPFFSAHPVAVTGQAAAHQALTIEMSDGSIFQVDVLGEGVNYPPTVEAIGRASSIRCEITDNFSMFRRTLYHFSRMVESGTPSIPPDETMSRIRLLIAGALALKERRRVELNELL